MYTNDLMGRYVSHDLYFPAFYIILTLPSVLYNFVDLLIFPGDVLVPMATRSPSNRQCTATPNIEVLEPQHWTKEQGTTSVTRGIAFEGLDSGHSVRLKPD